MTRIEADWLSRAETRSVFTLLAGHSAYAVGGCVRNTLLDQAVNDIDIATDARPERVIELAEAAGLKTIPTGVEHGTVTVVAGDVPFEITTFRRDVETDGRRAVVAYAGSIEEDARRRDFTMNALYADAAGEVLDPVGGLSDLRAGRVRFIEDAERRIREDYLRSLRFFRFSAFFGDPSGGMDPEALDAIARNLPGLETLSRERVGTEMLRLLEAADPAPAVAAMRATGVLGTVLPGADDRMLAPLIALERGLSPRALRRLAVLGGDNVAERLRLSRKDAGDLAALRSAGEMSPGEIGYRLGAGTGRDALLVRAASLGVPVKNAELEAVAAGAKQHFPVKAADLMPGLDGPALGEELARLERAWIASGFALSREALLAKG